MRAWNLRRRDSGIASRFAGGTRASRGRADDRLRAMQLYVIRHAEAEPGGAVGDAARRLTPRGQQEARALAAALRARAVRWDALLTSPRERARETAALLAPALASSAPE